MSITLKEALSLDILQQTRVIAGQSGLNRIITWVNILEVLDEINFLQEGDLLVTTAYGLTDNPQLTSRLIPFLAERKLAGIAIQTGYYLQDIPRQIIQQCDFYELPLLELPKSIVFTDLTKSILKKVINTQIEMLEYSQKIRHRFTQVILKNEGLGQIAGVLSELLNAPVCIYDKNFHVLVNEGMTENEANLIKTIRPKDISGQEVYKKNNTVLQPLIAGNEIHGYIAAFSSARRFNDMEMSALSSAATTCTLEMLKAYAVEEAENRVKGDFLDDLLEDRVSSQEIIHRRANYLGYDLTQSFLILCLDIDDFVQLSAQKSESELQEIKKRLLFLVRSCLHSMGLKALLKYHSDKIVVMLQIPPDNNHWESTRQLAEEIRKNAKQEISVSISIGVGQACSDLMKISSSYHEAIQALSISKKLWKDGRVLFYRDLGVYKLFSSTAENSLDLSNFYRDTVGPLIEYDRKHSSEFIHTLDVFLQSNEGRKEAAERLFCHRHTLTYRLNRIQEITKLDPEDAQTRFQLQLGLVVARLLGHL